jgi:tetratricopeptide (TPR) repeat protein
MEKKIISIVMAAALAAACGGSGEVNQSSVPPIDQPKQAEAPMSVSSRGTASEAPAAESGKSKWRQSGTPVDSAKVDADIARAQKEFDAAKGNATKKKALADAFFARGELLRDNAQYASALGDYRKVLKLEPSNAKAQERIDEIVGIYNSMNREYPPEGQEPEALRKQ